MRILTINNYSLDDAIKNTEAGLQPAHHCWGVDFLREQGHDCHTALFCPNARSGIVRKFKLLAFNTKLLFLTKNLMLL